MMCPGQEQLGGRIGKLLGDLLTFTVVRLNSPLLGKAFSSEMLAACRNLRPEGWCCHGNVVQSVVDVHVWWAWME